MAPRWSESYKPRYALGLVKMETASKVEERGKTRLKLTRVESKNQPPSPRSTEEKWVETKAARKRGSVRAAGGGGDVESYNSVNYCPFDTNLNLL